MRLKSSETSPWRARCVTPFGLRPDRSLAGLMPLAAEADNVSVVVSRAPMISGRVIDSHGTPRAARPVAVRIDTGPDFARAGHQFFLLGTDDQGRFKVSAAAPVGSQGEVSVSHQERGNSRTPRTVVGFEVFDANPIVIPDLIVPAERPTK